MDGFNLKNSYIYFVLACLCLPIQAVKALTISSASTTGVTQALDPLTNTMIFTATEANANLHYMTVQSALGTTDVSIRDTIEPDIVLASGTKIRWINGNNLTINAMRHIVFNNQTQINSQGNGNLVLRADAYGNTEGTLLPPFDNEIAVLMEGGGVLKVFYRPINYQTPTDFSTFIKVRSPDLFMPFMAINSFADLQKMNQNLKGNYALAKTIEATGLPIAPIGTETEPFSGHFDGQGYRINKITIYMPQANNVGLFGYTTDAAIENVSITNASITGKDNVGGLIGNASVSSPSFTGANIRYTSVEGDISGIFSVGGLIGSLNIGNSSVIQSFSTGSAVSLDTSFADRPLAGGLIGFANGAIIDSYSASTVRGGTNYGIGGLFARSSNIFCLNCYAVGLVTTGLPISYNGGIMGRYTVGSFKGAFWDKETTGMSYAAGHTTSIPGTAGLTTQEMQQKETFAKAGWDFDNVWDIEQNAYPYLRWTKISPPWTVMPNIALKNLKIVN